MAAKVSRGIGRGGARIGAGAKPGSKQRSTLVRERAEAAYLTHVASRRDGKRLAIDVLEDLMFAFYDTAAYNQPIVQPDGTILMRRGAKEERYETFGDLAAKYAAKLAEFQTPKLRSIVVPADAPRPGSDLPAVITFDVFDENNRLVPNAYIIPPERAEPRPPPAVHVGDAVTGDGESVIPAEAWAELDDAEARRRAERREERRRRDRERGGPGPAARATASTDSGK